MFINSPTLGITPVVEKNAKQVKPQNSQALKGTRIELWSSYFPQSNYRIMCGVGIVMSNELYQLINNDLPTVNRWGVRNVEISVPENPADFIHFSMDW